MQYGKHTFSVTVFFPTLFYHFPLSAGESRLRVFVHDTVQTLNGYIIESKLWASCVALFVFFTALLNGSGGLTLNPVNAHCHAHWALTS